MSDPWQAAFAQFQIWGKYPQNQRDHVLRSWISELPSHIEHLKLSSEAQQAIDEICLCGEYFCTLAELNFNMQTLTGITGERNELHFHGKGIFTVGELDQTKPSLCNFTRLINLTVAALLCGNSVLLHYIHPLEKWQKCLLISLSKSLPNDLLQLTSRLDWLQMNRHSRLTGVAFIEHSKPNETAQFRRLLSQRTGPIICQVSVSHQASLEQVFHPECLLPFISETCISQNCTAIGGNIELLSR
ncbi:hypothetical protein K6Y31_06580 [Motilimonas cestriensis]|uniref:Uncharacterized protein n=1 Tax=Motilimonas cestriensis TaxID=2742685 RepID=A0ABS8W7L2_9GAMM|nr:hypothetical protein [Motilimonas cestriensis]MCE2594475.1 hypothetical protein [Motilimonas cestriensis]